MANFFDALMGGKMERTIKSEESFLTPESKHELDEYMHNWYEHNLIQNAMSMGLAGDAETLKEAKILHARQSGGGGGGGGNVGELEQRAIALQNRAAQLEQEIQTMKMPDHVDSSSTPQEKDPFAKVADSATDNSIAIPLKDRKSRTRTGITITSGGAPREALW